LVEGDPKAEVTLDLAKGEARCAGKTFAAQMADGPRQQFLTGAWDAAGELVSGLDAVRKTAGKLPYVSAFG
jgi:3-isopropylmalate/(R)-2-methylmalate dehydratase small subunit